MRWRCGRILLLTGWCLVCAVSARSAEESDSAKVEGNRSPVAEEKASTTTSLAQKLAKRVTVSTERELLRAFIRRISEDNDINVVLDERIFDGASEPRLRHISLKDMPLGTALKAVLRTVGLDYGPYKHFIFISTRARLRNDPLEALETRFYELKGSMGDSLPKVVLVNPAAGGQGTFGSITELTRPVNPAVAGEQMPSGSTR